MSNSTQNSAPASITKADVTSNVDTEKSVSLVNGILRLTYHESILQDTVKAYVVFSDVGNAIEGQSAVEGLPLLATNIVPSDLIAIDVGSENPLPPKSAQNPTLVTYCNSFALVTI